MTPPTVSLSVLAPVTPAIERVKTVLFRPFDAGRWLTLAFCAWLAGLGGCGSGGGGGGGHSGAGGGQGGNVRRELRTAWEYVGDNLHWILPLVLALVVVGLGIWAVFTWLSSRGQFMLLHGVATNRAEVREPWRRYATEANSLFWFRIVLGFVSFLVVFPAVVGGVVMILFMLMQEQATAGLVLGSIGTLGGAMMFGLGFKVVEKLTLDFGVPLMALRSVSCRAAWAELLGLFSARKAAILLYLIFQVALATVVGIGVFALVIITCCIAGCLLALPFVGTVLLLPVLVFDRAYSLYYLEQLGAGYQVITE